MLFNLMFISFSVSDNVEDQSDDDFRSIALDVVQSDVYFFQRQRYLLFHDQRLWSSRSNYNWKYIIIIKKNDLIILN